jgi:NAD(P)H-nitrite reductase large subunit
MVTKPMNHIDEKRHVVIVGNGVAGITTARHLRKQSNCRITVVSSESMFYYSRPALMYLYMDHMQFDHVKPYENWFWEKNRIELTHDFVDRIDIAEKSIHLREGSPLPYDDLVLATGATHNVFGWPGQDLDGVQGFTNLADLHKLERHSEQTTHAVIVGGGLIGVEVAEMLRSRGIGVTMLVREELYWNNVLPVEEARMVGGHILEHGVDLQLETELISINDNGDHCVESVTTSAGETIPCQLVVLTAGVHPRVDLARNAHLAVGRGILVNEFFETSKPHIYAVVHRPRPRQAPCRCASWQPNAV